MSDFDASLQFCRDQFGLAEEAVYDDPPYATLIGEPADVNTASISVVISGGVIMMPGLAAVGPGSPRANRGSAWLRQ